MLDLSILTPYSRNVHDEIARRHPLWLKHATNQDAAWDARDDGMHEPIESDEPTGDKNDYVKKNLLKCFLNIRFPSPVPGNYPLDMTTIPGDGNETTVEFGPAHDHIRVRKFVFWRGSVQEEMDAAEELMAQIVMEKLTGFESRHGIGFAGREKWESLRQEKCLKKSWSWLGNFNFPEGYRTPPGFKRTARFTPSELFPYYHCADCGTLLILNSEELTRGEIQCKKCGTTAATTPRT